MITFIAWIVDSFMNRLKMYFQSRFCQCHVFAYITRVFDFLMDFLDMLNKMMSVSCLILTISAGKFDLFVYRICMLPQICSGFTSLITNTADMTL